MNKVKPNVKYFHVCKNMFSVNKQSYLEYNGNFLTFIVGPRVGKTS